MVASFRHSALMMLALAWACSGTNGNGDGTDGGTTDAGHTRDAGGARDAGAGQAADLDALDQAAFEALGTAYAPFVASAEAVWNEAANTRTYELHKIPLYFIHRDSGANIKGWLINHPSVPAGATLVNHAAFANVGTVYRYDDELFKLPADAPFAFAIDVAGTPSYVFPFDNADQSPSDSLFIPLIVHEGFHRYQEVEGGWTEPSGWVQSNESTYPLTAEFVALFLLEEKILLQGVNILTAMAAQTALKQLIAVRKARAALPESTVGGVNVVTNGDNGQEWNEGTPTYVERAFDLAAGRMPDPNSTIGGRLALSSLSDTYVTRDQAKAYIASFRQYGSGGALALLLDAVGGVDWRSACKSGTTPYDSANALYSTLTQGELDTLLGDAKTAHDYDGTVVPLATTISMLP